MCETLMGPCLLCNFSTYGINSIMSLIILITNNYDASYQAARVLLEQMNFMSPDISFLPDLIIGVSVEDEFTSKFTSSESSDTSAA